MHTSVSVLLDFAGHLGTVPLDLNQDKGYAKTIPDCCDNGITALA
jgi:hypothetical protein